MKKLMWAVVIIILIIIGAWLLSAKTASAPTQVATSTASGIPQDNFGTYSYECDEHVTFTMTPASDMSIIYIAPNGGAATYPPATTLTRVATSSGVLYRGGGLTFFGRGESVSLTEGTQSLNCSPVPSQDNAPFNFGD